MPLRLTRIISVEKTPNPYGKTGREVPIEERIWHDSGTVRRLRASDLEAVLEIEAESPEAANWSKESYLSLLGEDGSLALVMEEGGEITGLLVGRRVGDQADVFNLAVKYKHRRKRQGTRLLNAALQEFAGQGAQKVYLDVRSSNTKAIAFYEKHGFAKTGQRKGYYRNPDEPALIMQKKLTA
jgi:ribosomal-protein-alanine acetyltransferase